jgi:hypothetical protein
MLKEAALLARDKMLSFAQLFAFPFPFSAYFVFT